jgi:hypothetical protein
MIGENSPVYQETMSQKAVILCQHSDWQSAGYYPPGTSSPELSVEAIACEDTRQYDQAAQCFRAEKKTDFLLSTARKSRRFP